MVAARDTKISTLKFYATPTHPTGLSREDIPKSPRYRVAHAFRPLNLPFFKHSRRATDSGAIVIGLDFCYTVVYNKRQICHEKSPEIDPVPQFGRHDCVTIYVISNTVAP
jgi:hypothetical protein